MDNYSQITWADVREGDVLFHENGDRLTVTETFPERLRAAGIDRLNERWEQGGFSPYRKVEPLPTMPGHYLDADGYHWKLTSNANRPWYMSVCDRNFTTEKMAKYAPFTRLVPMPTEEQLGRRCSRPTQGLSTG